VLYLRKKISVLELLRNFLYSFRAVPLGIFLSTVARSVTAVSAVEKLPANKNKPAVDRNDKLDVVNS